MTDRLKTAILGSTGMVGQRLVSLVASNPLFELDILAASSKSSGHSYADSCKWILENHMPESAADIRVIDVDSYDKIAKECDVVFSALPSSSGPLEEKLADKIPVISKSSAHRMDHDVPLMIPGINDGHLELIEVQRTRRKSDGYISCDPNCSSTQLAVVLKALEPLGLENVLVDSMQAVSGAGHPGLSSLDISDNIIPYIVEEEQKLKREPGKILGTYSKVKRSIEHRNLSIIAKCNRVNVSEGHLQSLFIKIKRDFTEDEVHNVLRNFVPESSSAKLHSFPEKLLIVREELDRPQPKYDRNAGDGMSITLGRIEKDGNYLKLSCLSHNTVLGAAGGAILHAELLHKEGYL